MCDSLHCFMSTMLPTDQTRRGNPVTITFTIFSILLRRHWMKAHRGYFAAARSPTWRRASPSWTRPSSPASTWWAGSLRYPRKTGTPWRASAATGAAAWARTWMVRWVELTHLHILYRCCCQSVPPLFFKHPGFRYFLNNPCPHIKRLWKVFRPFQLCPILCYKLLGCFHTYCSRFSKVSIRYWS